MRCPGFLESHGPLSLRNPIRSGYSRIPGCISSVPALFFWVFQPKLSTDCFGWILSSCFDQILWSFVSGRTEPGPALPLIRQSREPGASPRRDTDLSGCGDWTLPNKTKQQNISLLLLPRLNPARMEGGSNPVGASSDSRCPARLLRPLPCFSLMEIPAPSTLPRSFGLTALSSRSCCFSLVSLSREGATNPGDGTFVSGGSPPGRCPSRQIPEDLKVPTAL